MFVGTGSDVGKSIVNAGFCRIFKQDGYHPAPFKAQNMSLNSYATPDGLEIGRAQAVQAEACGIDCSAEMNPILLKPSSYLNSQVVLNGKPLNNQSASDYFLKTDRDFLFSEAINAYHKLAQQYSPLVMEGAGSISEINLRDKDITNMRVALETNAAVYLIADIDRGGIFGSIYGTMELLPPEERKLIKGIVINKFRGEIKLFEEGKEKLEELTGVPVVSIIPYYDNIHIEEEDSVIIDNKTAYASDKKINVAVVLLKHMSNFTDFNMLERIEDIHLYYASDPEELHKADIIVIPGSKNTISEMHHLRTTGMAKAILQSHEQGKAVYGICGGFQLMGKEINDPYQVEGDIATMPALGILPVSTTLSKEKTTRQCSFQFLNDHNKNAGYEIHMGETTSNEPSPLCLPENGQPDGYFLNNKTWGTYIHGILDNEAIINHILKHTGIEKSVHIPDYKKFKEEQYDKLAEHIRKNTNMNKVYESLQNQE